MSMISVENISAGYSKDNVVEQISFSINEGELIGILGANGCGKSTLAKAICNILPHSGKVSVDGKKIEELKVSQVANIISYIPQHSGISIDISVLDVVMMGFNARLRLLERPGKDMEAQAKSIIESLGLGDRVYDNFLQLSEGQKQLVILARALVSDGNFLVMDEPESALDFNVRYKLMKIVRKWIDEGNRAGMVILHDTMLALNNCDRLLLLKDKQIVGTIDLNNDTIEAIENNIKTIYGDISLVKNVSKNGKENLIMVCDSIEV